MTEDEWQAHVTREAAKEIGAWLEARGRLDQPIRSLTLRDLEAHRAERHHPLHRAGLAPDRGGTGQHQRSPPLPDERMILCAICDREARGFGFCLSLRFDLYPHHRFCSMRCLDRGAAIAREKNGMIDKTAREIQAPRRMRGAPFAEAITEMGLMPVFHDRKPEDIDAASSRPCVDGLRRQHAAAGRRA